MLLILVSEFEVSESFTSVEVSMFLTSVYESVSVSPLDLQMELTSNLSTGKSIVVND